MSNDWNCFQPFRTRFILFQTHSHLKSWYIIILFAQGHLPTAVYRHSLVAWQPSAVELMDDMRYQHVIAVLVLIPLNQHVWPLCTRPSTCKPNRIHTIRAENQYHGSRAALLCTGECQKQGTLLGMCLPSLRMTDSVGTLSLSSGPCWCGYLLYTNRISVIPQTRTTARCGLLRVSLTGTDGLSQTDGFGRFYETLTSISETSFTIILLNQTGCGKSIEN